MGCSAPARPRDTMIANLPDKYPLARGPGNECTVGGEGKCNDRGSHSHRALGFSSRGEGVPYEDGTVLATRR